jgi:hypothetical protein
VAFTEKKYPNVMAIYKIAINVICRRAGIPRKVLNSKNSKAELAGLSVDVSMVEAIPTMS